MLTCSFITILYHIVIINCYNCQLLIADDAVGPQLLLPPALNIRL